MSNGTNKLGNIADTYKQDNFKYLVHGIVESIADEFGMGRIKVRIKGAESVGGDDGIENKNLPWSHPLIPKHISTIPKVGEIVWVFIINNKKKHSDRLYIGPLTSQLQLLNKDSGFISPLRPFTFGQQDGDQAVTGEKISTTILPELIGVFPNPEDISIQGRFNTDITQKHNQIVIRAGKFETSENNKFRIKFNSKTQGFIQIKNNVIISEKDVEAKESGTVTNIVSNKINLLTHKGGSPRFNLTDQEQLITDEEMLNILNDAHQLPFGDVLLDYLKLLKNAILSHVHNGNGNPSTDLTSSGNIQSIANLKANAKDLENKMLSKNIRIN